MPADASAPAVVQDQATAATRPAGPGRPAGQSRSGAADPQAPEVKPEVNKPEVKETRPSGQDLHPSADSRPVTDLQAAQATQPPAEDVAKAAPVAVQPDAGAVSARTTSREPAAAPVPASASTKAPAPAGATPKAAANSILASPPPAVPSPSPAVAPAASSAAPKIPQDSQDAQDSRTVVTVVPGVPRYHNATCILIRFMGEGDLETMTLAAARAAGCTPCRACLPDQPDKQPDLPPPRRTGQAEHRPLAGSAIDR
jgi:hypothetical protein